MTLPPDNAVEIDRPSQITDEDLATAWQRFWARGIDAMLFSIPFAFAMALLIPSYPNHSTLESIVSGMLLVPIILMIEAACVSHFGNSPGKRVLGIKPVTTEGRPITFRTAITRQLHLWMYGYCFGIPIASTIASLIAGYQIRRDGFARWDKQAGTKVIGHGSWWRTGLSIILFVILTAIITIPSVIAGLRNTAPDIENVGNVDDIDAAVAAAVKNTEKITDAADTDAQFEAMLVEWRKELPMRIDEDTVLDNVKWEMSNRLSYYYTLPEVAIGKDALQSNSKLMREALNEKALPNFCDDQDGLGLREMGASVRYVYHDKNGHLAAIVEYMPSDCNS